MATNIGYCGCQGYYSYRGALPVKVQRGLENLQQPVKADQHLQVSSTNGDRAYLDEVEDFVVEVLSLGDIYDGIISKEFCDLVEQKAETI